MTKVTSLSLIDWPRFTDHIHGDETVTVERVARFGNAHHRIQLAVLAHLRRKAVFHHSDVTVAAVGILLAGSAVAYSLLAWSFGDPPAPSLLPLIVTTGGVLAILVGGTAAINALLWAGRREKTRATVWLAAYEDELAVRWAAKGVHARRWQNARRPRWDGGARERLDEAEALRRVQG